MKQSYRVCVVTDGKVVIENTVFLPPKKARAGARGKYLFIIFFNDEGISSSIYGTRMRKGYSVDSPWEEWQASGIRCDGGEG